MMTEVGRPRNRAIDEAVLRATVELIGETSYADLSLDAVAARAGTSKPAIYRRWRGKAHLVHEAVFPIDATTDIPDAGSLEDDVREMIRRTLAVLSTPAARAALPGLVGEMASDPTLHTALLERFGDILVRGLNDYLRSAVTRGEVRDGVTATELAEAIAGMTLLALLTRGANVDGEWIERTAQLITKGISS
jgi:AcrR family transcriptional regulator